MQNIGGLDHFHHEGRVPGMDFILCADAREDAVHQANPGGIDWNK